MVLIPRHNIRHENPTPLHGRRAVGRALGQTGPYTLEEKREDTQSSLSLQNSEALLELCSSRHWANIGSFFDTERRSFKRLGAPSTKLKLASVHSNIGPIWKNADPKLRVRASRSNHLGSLISEALVGDSSKPDHVTGRELDAKALGEGLPLGGVPDDQAERDLVHKVRQVVDEVQSGRSDRTAKVAEEVTQGVDGPADSDDEAHGTEGRLHGLGNTSGGDLASLTDEDLEQDVAPSAHAHNEAHPGIDPMLLTHVAEGKHDLGLGDRRHFDDHPRRAEFLPEGLFDPGPESALRVHQDRPAGDVALQCRAQARRAHIRDAGDATLCADIGCGALPSGLVAESAPHDALLGRLGTLVSVFVPQRWRG